MSRGTLRDEFAGLAMQAMISTASGPCMFGLDGAEKQMALAAYRIADAMLEAKRQAALPEATQPCAA